MTLYCMGKLLREPDSPVFHRVLRCLKNPLQDLRSDRSLVQFHSGDPVLIIKRYGRAVLDRLLEIVNRDILPENLSRALPFAGD